MIHKDIGVIKMEVIRNVEPKDDFLQKVRDLATKRGIVFNFSMNVALGLERVSVGYLIITRFILIWQCLVKLLVMVML